MLVDLDKLAALSKAATQEGIERLKSFLDSAERLPGKTDLTMEASELRAITDYIDALRAELAEVEKERDEHANCAEGWRKTAEAAEAREAKLREALEFYATSVVMDNERPWEGGKRACAALADKEWT